MHIHIGVVLVRVGLWHADKTETINTASGDY